MPNKYSQFLQPQPPFWRPSRGPESQEGSICDGLACNGKSKGDLELTPSQKIAEKAKARSRIERRRKAKAPTQASYHAQYGYTNGFMS